MHPSTVHSSMVEGRVGVGDDERQQTITKQTSRIHNTQQQKFDSGGGTPAMVPKIQLCSHIISVSIIVHPLHPAVQGGLLYPTNELKHPRTYATVPQPTYRIANRRPSIISYDPSLTKIISSLRMAIILRVFGMVILAHVCALAPRPIGQIF